MDFKQAEQEFRQLKARFEAKELTEAEFKTRLQDLMVQDEQGSWWMIGYETERWYRHDGTSWVRAEPPGGLLQEAAPAISSRPETVESEEVEKPARIPAAHETAAEAPPVNIGTAHREMAKAQPASRRFPYSLMTAGLVIVLLASIGLYSILRRQPQEPAPAPTKAQVTVTTIHTARATPTPTPPTSLPSPTPEATTTSTPGISVTIAVSQARLYQGPDLAFGLVVQDTYPLGTNFIVIARDSSGRWFLSRAPDGRVGWLYLDWIDSESDLSLAPTPATLPAPPPTSTRRPRNTGPRATPTFG